MTPRVTAEAAEAVSNTLAALAVVLDDYSTVTRFSSEDIDFLHEAEYVLQRQLDYLKREAEYLREELKNLAKHQVSNKTTGTTS